MPRVKRSEKKERLLEILIELIDYKQLLDEVFVISEIIKVEASVISWGQHNAFIIIRENIVKIVKKVPQAIFTSTPSIYINT